MALITLLRPGHKPPQVTIPTCTVSASKKILLLGPAFWKQLILNLFFKYLLMKKKYIFFL